ncbi:MAG TPA: alkylmercury lyase family protein [Candidatus Eisenbacteria bacterium]|nr:alkylmercury lyase family protein [Candidatus Eisenbacteria bacterium]
MTQQSTRAGQLHYELIRGFIDTCAVPSREELQARLSCSSAELGLAIEDLEDAHGIVLHPGTHKVWAVHPFSAAPTPFVVQSGKKKWWGNCTWCSLGIAVLVGEPCTIVTTLGAETDQVALTVDEGKLNRTDLVVHFPIPMSQAWENVVYTCSTMLLFKDENHVAEWCKRHRIPQGDVQPVEKVLELAKRWYTEHLSPDWTKKSANEARAIFTELGFTHPVWALPASEGRF